MEQWDYLLLKEIALETSAHKTAQICQTDVQLNIASDESSAKEENKTTFGWLIVNKDKEILVEHAGPAFGQATSFRVEGYVLLSVARCLHHISQYTNQAIWYDINMYIVNKEIVKRINDQLTYTYDYPFNTLKPDWDVVAQVPDTLTQYIGILTITHVKSHQDDNTPLKELSLPARLDVTDDHLASSYSIQHGISCLEVPRMTIKCAQLCTKNGVISSHYHKKIRDLATTQDLSDYIKEKRGWSDETFDSVDWKTYQCCKNRQHYSDSQIIKFMHNILPTAQHTKIYDKNACTQCTFCNHTSETRDHLL
eukprot:15367141-Ditylum_brightwellii.AAC.1